MDDSDDLALEEAIKEQVDNLMAIENDPSMKFLPLEARRAKIEHEVRAALDFSELGKTVGLAYEILRKEGSIYLNTEENVILQESLDQFCEQLENVEIKELTDEKMNAALALSEKSKHLILKIGIEKFRQEKIEETLEILTFLTTIDEEEADYWYRLGLVAMKSGKYDLGLRAFTTTSDLAPDFIGGHLNAAECYLKIGKRLEADSALKEAKKCLKSEEAKDWGDRIHEIEQLIIRNGGNYGA